MDRNADTPPEEHKADTSLSARRAWIEIFYYADKDCDWVRSLSARRAWIEILTTLSDGFKVIVALRKESVDRNVSPSQKI